MTKRAELVKMAADVLAEKMAQDSEEVDRVIAAIKGPSMAGLGQAGLGLAGLGAGVFALRKPILRAASEGRPGRFALLALPVLAAELAGMYAGRKYLDRPRQTKLIASALEGDMDRAKGVQRYIAQDDPEHWGDISKWFRTWWSRKAVEEALAANPKMGM